MTVKAKAVNRMHLRIFASASWKPLKRNSIKREIKTAIIKRILREKHTFFIYTV
jgi:hypothetical protein